MRSARVLAVALACLAPLAATGCRERRQGRPAEPPPAPHVDAGLSRLPEDPVAGKRAEAQWRQHLLHEERERQLGFDRRHLAQHRAVIALIESARQSYERARTPAALARVVAGMPRRIEEIRKRVIALDHWGVNSRLLGDYAALEDTLERIYPPAKRAAAKGDTQSLESARGDFDRRMKVIATWLDEATASDGDGDGDESPPAP